MSLQDDINIYRTSQIFMNFANRLHFVREIFCLHICYTLIYIIYKDGELLYEILMR